MKFSSIISGPNHEVSSQSVVTKDWLGSFHSIDGPSWPYDGPVGEEILWLCLTSIPLKQFVMQPSHLGCEGHESIG